MAIQTLYCMYDIVSKGQKDDKMQDCEKGQTGQGQGQNDHDLLSNGGDNEDVVVDTGDTTSLHPEQVIIILFLIDIVLQ